MKNFIVYLFFVIAFPVFVFSQSGDNLANAVLKSFADNNYSLLDGYLLNEKTAKSAFPNDFKGMSSKDIKSKITPMNEKIKNTWQTIYDKMGENGVSPSKVVIKETAVTPVIPGKEMLGLIAQYEYEGNLYEDFNLIVVEAENQLFLIDFPSSTRTLTLFTGGKSSFIKEKNKQETMTSGIATQLKERVDVVLSTLGSEDITMFANFCVYRGDDESRKWNDRVDIYNESEMEHAVIWKNKLNKVLAVCGEKSFGEYQSETESEGTWIVQPIHCADGSTVYLAFLSINNELLLGDIDVEKPK